MENIKEQLKNVIVDVILPESEAYLAELNKAIEDNEINDETMDAKADIEGFIEELKTVIVVIDEDKISDEDAKMVFEKITLMLSEHES